MTTDKEDRMKPSLNDFKAMIPKRIRMYLDLLAKMGTFLGDAGKGEIEIITDPALILEIEAARKKALRGFRIGEFSGSVPPWQSGIILTDPFFIFIRDPVRFPDGSLGLYDRVLFANEIIASSGVSILAIDRESRKIILAVTFRHATRSYFAESPGCITRIGESFSDTLRRCVEDDLGASSDSVKEKVLLGFSVAEKGIVGAKAPIYAVLIDGIDKIDRRKNPLTAGYILLSREEYSAARLKGKVVFKERVCDLGDAYTDSGVILASASGII